MSTKTSNIIEQSTFLGFYGKIRIEFEEDGVRIYDSYRESEGKEKFFAYRDIDLHNPTKIKSNELYYLLVGIVFFVFGVITRDIFFLIMGSIFFFLYFRSYQKHIILNYDFVLLDDKKYPEIVERIKQIQAPIRKEEEYKIYPYSSREDEIQRMEGLHKDGVISEKELEKIMSEIEGYDFGGTQYRDEKEVIAKLLEERGIVGDFSLESIVYEGDTLPRGVRSISGETRLVSGDIYEFWLRWDKNSIDPKTGKTGSYTLGDDSGTIGQYGRSFFEKKITAEQ